MLLKVFDRLKKAVVDKQHIQLAVTQKISQTIYIQQCYLLLTETIWTSKYEHSLSAHSYLLHCDFLKKKKNKNLPTVELQCIFLANLILGPADNSTYQRV